MDIQLIIELIILFLALIAVNYDVKNKPLDRKVFYVWVIGTAIGYYFYSLYGVGAVLLLYFAWTRALLKRWDMREKDNV
ncbi:MAG: hypothetical protein ACOCSJ_02935 [Candidatus Natronoplasma sp.]